MFKSEEVNKQLERLSVRGWKTKLEVGMCWTPKVPLKMLLLKGGGEVASVGEHSSWRDDGGVRRVEVLMLLLEV